MKLVLPYLFCEKCYRKRFCLQVEDQHMCGLAVFVSKDAIVY